MDDVTLREPDGPGLRTSQRLQLSHTDRRARLGSALLLASLAVMWPLTVIVSRGPIERTLERRVRGALDLAGYSGVDVSASGQDITLRGLLPTVVDRERAIQLAKSRKGVRIVFASTSALKVDAAAPTVPTGSTITTEPADTSSTLPIDRPTKVAVTIAGTTVTISATVSDAAVKDLLVGPSQAAIPADAFVDNVHVDPADGTSNAAAHERVGTFIGALLALGVGDATLQFDNGSLLARATVRDLAQQDAFRAAALTLVGEPSKLAVTFVVNASDASGSSTSSPGATEPSTNGTSNLPSTTTSTTIATTTTSELPPVTPELIQAAQAAIQVNLEGKVITFEKDSAALDAAGKQVIDGLAEAIKAIPSTGLRFEVAGFTDNKGSTAGNVRLSQRRASAVRQRLVAAGISASRIDAIGFGEDQPIADNATDSGRAQNRRIEIQVIDPTGVKVAQTTVAP